jgi:hypothetical protein
MNRLHRRLVVALALLGALSFLAFGGEELVVGRLTLVEASEDVPYAYWYYVPETVLDGRVAGLVWHATPGGTGPDDPVFWAKFDLAHFLACRSRWAKPSINLPEVHGSVLFSVAVARPDPSFYTARPRIPLGSPDALNSLGSLDGYGDGYRDPDLKALASIDDLKRRLADAGIRFDPRLFLTGVYNGAEWAHRFALLHPTEVRAVAPVCGNVYTMPFGDIDEGPLPWPLGLANFEALGRGLVDWESYVGIPYYLTASIHENVWYNAMTPEEQGIETVHLERYVNAFGAIPPERAAAFAGELAAAGVDCRLVWSEGGHGWIDPVRLRVFEFFAGFELDASPVGSPESRTSLRYSSVEGVGEDFSSGHSGACWRQKARATAIAFEISSGLITTRPVDRCSQGQLSTARLACSSLAEIARRTAIPSR